MKSKKKPATPPEPDKQEETNAAEAKVKRMLDPNEPDIEETDTSSEEAEDKPKSKAKEEAAEETPATSTAPEVKTDEKPPAKTSKITVKDGNDEEEAEEANTPDDQEPKAETEEKAEEDSETETDESQQSESDSSNEISEDTEDKENVEPDEEAAQVEASEGAETAEPDEASTEAGVQEPGVDIEELSQSPELEDEETAKAVEDISRQESDSLLAAEDKEVAKSFDDKKPSPLQRIKNFFKAWWQNRIARRATIIILILGLVAAITVPVSRYMLLNTFGVRSRASVAILDKSTLQPLRNVSVSLKDQTVLTDDNGVAEFQDLKLGATNLVIEKRAFAPVNQPVTIGWGGNPLGQKDLIPVGSQYSFFVSDYLSGEPLQKVEAVSREASAYSDENGRIKLTVDKIDDSPVEVQIVGEGLRQEELVIDADDKSEHALEMVPARKHVFISQRSGKYDVYKIDVDGKNEKLILPGTGSERSDMVVVPHPSKELAALVSRRDEARNSDGYLLSTLTLIDLEDDSTVEVARSERVQIVGWLDDKLIYVRIAAGASAGNPQRHRLISYDTVSLETTQIASSNFFNDVLTALGKVYYAPSTVYQESGEPGLYQVDADNNKQHIFHTETWSVFRISYYKFALAVGQDWYEYDLGSATSDQLPGEPPNLRSRIYVDSPDNLSSLWVDQRDGKGVLLTFNLENNEDVEIYQRSGLKSPTRWLNNNSVVFRVETDQETADYAMSLNGGEPRKIRDVTNTSGLEGWYHY